MTRATHLPAPGASEAALAPAEKAAIILAALPRETARSIIDDVGDEHLGAFFRALSGMRAPPAHARISIAQEFVAEVLRRAAEPLRGPDAANKLLFEIAERGRAERVLSSLPAEDAGARGLWTRAAALPTDRLLTFLLEQRMQTAAAILANLPATRAADIISAAPIAFAQSVTAVIARLQHTDAAVSEAIARAMEAELAEGPSTAAVPESVSAYAVDILDHLPPALRDGILERLKATDGAVAAAIRKSLLTFEGLAARLTEAAVASLVRTAERETLLRGLKFGATNAIETVEFLLANMSKRMADQFREELAALPEPAPAEGEAAQRSLVAAVKSLEKSGEIRLKPVT